MSTLTAAERRARLHALTYLDLAVQALHRARLVLVEVDQNAPATACSTAILGTEDVVEGLRAWGEPH